MKEYMIALHSRFNVPSEEEREQKEIIEKKEGKLKKHLNRKERRLLLCLMDEMEMYRLQSQLSSFIAGYKVALGISKELDEIPDFTESVARNYSS